MTLFTLKSGQRVNLDLVVSINKQAASTDLTMANGQNVSVKDPGDIAALEEVLKTK